jgi:hypothetical protein
MTTLVNATLRETTYELRVTASGDRGARALACLLADVGQLQGMTTLSMRTAADPLRVRRPDQTEHVTLRLVGPGLLPVSLTAVMTPQLMNEAGDGFLVLNTSQAVRTETVCSIDADGIAQSLGIPAYLPMVGAIARAAGWADLNRVKAAVRMALEGVAPYWVESGLAGVEAGFYAVA